MKRTLRPNSKYCGSEWCDDKTVICAISRKAQKVEEKVWEIEDILDRREGSSGREVLVRWKGVRWEGHDSWVSLANNPELAAFVYYNKANPTSSTLARKDYARTQANVPHPQDYDLQFLRQEVIEALGEPKPTPDGNEGFVHRVSVRVPFRPESFEKHFRHLPGMPPVGNVPGAYFTLPTIENILGKDVTRRPARNSSSEMKINSRFKIRLAWEYKSMVRYDHSDCPSCLYRGPEAGRPYQCEPVETAIPSQPTLTMTFSRLMINTLAGTKGQKL